MKINQQAERLQYLVELLQEQHTGAAAQLAQRIGISRSKLFELLEELKGAGAKIEYNRQKNSYYLADSCRINVNQPITIEQVTWVFKS